VSLALLAVVCLAGLSIVVHALRVGISPMPTSGAVRAVLLEQFPRELTGELHELGAGWGSLALPLAARCPKAQVVAWESSPVPFLVLWLRARASGRGNLRLERRDFFEAELGGASAVCCYLFTGAMTRLEPKLRAELKPGSLVVSHTFALRGWTPEATAKVDDLYQTPVYRYRA
jgi:hypothetical protein